MYQGRDQESIQFFERALKLYPEQYLWWMNLGVAYRRLHLTADAERANRRGLELADVDLKKNPRSGYVRACLAYLCAWLGEHDRAKSNVEQALQFTPKDSDTLRMAVKTYEALGRRKDSLAVLETSPAEVRLDVARYPDLADLARDSRFQKMLATRQQMKTRRTRMAIQHDIQNIRGYACSCRAYLCAWLGDRRRAQLEIARALRLSPDDRGTRRNAVKTYEALGRRADSLAVLSNSAPEVVADISQCFDLADLRQDFRFQKLLASSCHT